LKNLRIFYHRDVDKRTKEIVRGTIEKTFSIEFKEGLLDIDINSAYNPSRDQYNADEILEAILQRYPGVPVLVIVPYDIYVPGLNFVFGVAMFGHGAVIGLDRFRYGDNYRMRVYKTVRHELGHVFGLRHCKNPCVMRFANSLLELDLKPSEFCDNCKDKLRKLGVLRENL